MFSSDEFEELTDLGMGKPGTTPTEVVNAKTGAVSKQHNIIVVQH